MQLGIFGSFNYGCPNMNQGSFTGFNNGMSVNSGMACDCTRANPMQNILSTLMVMAQLEMMLSHMMNGGMPNGANPWGFNNNQNQFNQNQCQGFNPNALAANYGNNNSGYNNAGNNGCSNNNSGTSQTNGSTDKMDLPQNGADLTFSQAAAMVRKAGGEVNPGGRPTVLALRAGNSATRNYGDTFLVLKPNGQIERFAGTTRPSKGGQDKAMLKTGNYNITPRWRDGKFNNDGFIVKSANNSMKVGVSRDTNGDGQYSQDELNRSGSSDTIRLHRGGKNGTSSAGCLNVKNYDGFLGAVGGKDSNFNLVVVNV